MNCDEVILQHINSLDIPFRKGISSTVTKWYPGAQAPPGVSADRRIIVYCDSNLPKLNIPTHYLFHKISQKYFTPTKNTSAVFVSLRRLCKPYDRKNYNTHKAVYVVFECTYTYKYSTTVLQHKIYHLSAFSMNL